MKLVSCLLMIGTDLEYNSKSVPIINKGLKLVNVKKC